MKKFNDQHKRSIAKTLTARVSFTLSHIINGYIVTGAFLTVVTIAGFATLVNMIMFWVHERVWNWAQWNRKSDQDTVFFYEGHPRTVSKSITWRALITINNFVIPYLTTGSWKTAVAFLGIATIMNIAIYYTHERVWNIFNWGKDTCELATS